MSKRFSTLVVLGTFLILFSGSKITGQVKPQYEEELKRVQEYIKKTDFRSAEHVLREMLSRHPDNPELLSILARLLSWDKRHAESLEVYRVLFKLDPSDEIKKDMERVLAARELQEIEEIMKRGRLDIAERRLKELYASELSRYEAGYHLGMLYIGKGDYEKALRIFKELKEHYPEDLGFQALYIESLILLGEIKEAKEKLSFLPEQERDELHRQREDLFYRVRRNRLTAKGEYYQYTRGHKDEQNLLVELSQRINDLTLVAGYSTQSRFGLRDIQIGFDLYSKLGERTKRWGYCFLRMSPDAEILPEWAIGGAVYQAFKGFELSAGYTRMQFKESSVDIFIPGFIAYLPSKFSLEERFFLVPRFRSYALLSTLDYEPNHRLKIFYSFVFGNSAERIGALQDVEKFDTFSHKLGIEYRFHRSLSVSGEYYYHRRKNLYDLRGFATYARYWW